jgi:hypothetical protein
MYNLAKAQAMASESRMSVLPDGNSLWNRNDGIPINGENGRALL